MSEQKRSVFDEPRSFIVEEDKSTGRSIVALATVAIIFLVCLLCAMRMADLRPTYNGSVNVAKLAEDPTAYSLEEADGAAYVIVAKNLEKTTAKNFCFSVVFNFRGFDTMGESFILITALSGSLCILRTAKKKKKEEPAIEEVAEHE